MRTNEGLMNENYCRFVGLGMENCCWSMDIVISGLSLGWRGGGKSEILVLTWELEAIRRFVDRI